MVTEEQSTDGVLKFNKASFEKRRKRMNVKYFYRISVIQASVLIEKVEGLFYFPGATCEFSKLNYKKLSVVVPRMQTRNKKKEFN